MVNGESAVTQRSGRPWQRWAVSVLRGALFVLWLLWAVTACWTVPQRATLAELHADAATSSVASVDRVDGWHREGVWIALPSPQYNSSGDVLTWQMNDGQVRYLDTAAAESVTDIPPGSDGTTVGPLGRALQQELTAAKHRAEPPAVRWEHGTSLAVGAGFVLGLLVLIMGPAPRRGNRWFWFWICGIPGGFGALAWLALERPWSVRAGRLSADFPQRPGGFRGFFLMIGATFVLSILLLLASAVSGNALTDWPSV